MPSKFGYTKEELIELMTTCQGIAANGVSEEDALAYGSVLLRFCLERGYKAKDLKG